MLLSSKLSSNKNKDLIRNLNNLGRLPKSFDYNFLIDLLEHENYKVRTLAVKNLAKSSNFSLLDNYVELVQNDKSSSVRREAASAIGRLKDRRAKNIMFQNLNDRDPEVVLQFIRGLLVFKMDEDVSSQLLKLNHPNEIIKEIIEREFNIIDFSPNSDHVSSPNYLKNTIVHGDTRDIIKKVPEESIHLTFTSPPYYNAKDYSVYKSYKDYLRFLKEIFREVFRVTKEGRFFVLNTSPVIFPRVGRKYSSKRYLIPYDIHPHLLEMGWEFIDDIVWVKPESTVKNRNGGFFQHRKPMAYKTNARTEYVMVYRKKTNKLIDWNIKQYDQKVIDSSKVKGEFESSNVWQIDPVSDKIHSAVFPSKLCDNVIKFYSFKGDLVFDPFAGSGTFGKSALKNNRFFFLIEKKEEYIKRIKENVFQNLEYKYFPKVFTKKKFLNLK